MTPTLGRLAGQVSSLRRGCYSQHSRLPDNYGQQMKSANGTSGFFPARPTA
jgi:hypothetical protein